MSPQREGIITEEDRRLGRLRNRHNRYPPLNMFAHWILEYTWFSYIIVFLIFLNTVVLGIQTEITDNMDPDLEVLKLVLDTLDAFTLVVFLLEILLKWVDDFTGFWKSAWNIFDLVVTVLSFLSEILQAFQGTDPGTLEVVGFLRKFRFLRSLKMVSKFRQLQILFLTVSKAFKAMTFVFLLLLVLFFIFALMGVHIFHSYYHSKVEGLVYRGSFKDMTSAFITLFILFTADHWYPLLAETWKVPELNQAICSIFIVVWLLIGAFIFRNIFIGILVNNFQAIRGSISKLRHQREIETKARIFKAEIEHNHTSCLSEHDLEEDCPVSSSFSSHLMRGEVDWETYVEENLRVIREKEETERVSWPKDSLFRYFEVLEMLQRNLGERNQLQNLTVMCQSS
ncbi:cation channel sperm-associated protein 2-like [Chanos chanos]|uniref:Cation channel sperm-associated protein 2-like n=1 Tax=Chanos chanos TaxID=29144 RepID=A0A6J2ULB8_CHACN|nr:cation channel sperm-associated protein 2 [Chanos chanos]